jgi:hypothetical protein
MIWVMHARGLEGKDKAMALGTGTAPRRRSETDEFVCPCMLCVSRSAVATS